MSGKEITTFEVAKKLLPKDIMIKWFEEELEECKRLWLQYNSKNYDKFLSEGLADLEELKQSV